MVADGYGADARGGAGVDQVAHAQGKESTDEGNDAVDGEEHVGRSAQLHCLTVEVETEGDLADFAAHLLQGDKAADGCGVVKGLTELPGQTFGAQVSLPIASGEVYADGHLVIVSSSEPFVDVFTQPVDLDDELRLVVHLVRKVGEEEGLAIFQHGIGFHEDRRLRGEKRVL